MRTLVSKINQTMSGPDADSALGGMSLRYKDTEIGNWTCLTLYEGSSNFTVESEFYRPIEENGRTYHRYKPGRKS